MFVQCCLWCLASALLQGKWSLLSLSDFRNFPTPCPAHWAASSCSFPSFLAVFIHLVLLSAGIISEVIQELLCCLDLISLLGVLSLLHSHPSGVAAAVFNCGSASPSMTLALLRSREEINSALGGIPWELVIRKWEGKSVSQLLCECGCGRGELGTRVPAWEKQSLGFQLHLALSQLSVLDSKECVWHKFKGTRCKKFWFLFWRNICWVYGCKIFCYSSEPGILWYVNQGEYLTQGDFKFKSKSSWYYPCNKISLFSPQIIEFYYWFLCYKLSIGH